MPVSSFSERFAAYDVTPVENLFLLEYMPYAPGDYVRVYLYGLMHCYHPDPDQSVEGIARVLGMKPQQVIQALRYWEQKGLLIGISDNPPKFQYENVRSAMLSDRSPESDAYRYREFNDELQRMLGLLHPQQFQKAMEWIEDLHLPVDVVLEMVREKLDQLSDGGKKKRSISYLFKAFDNCALDLAEKSIRTVDDARKELARGKPYYKLASRVLDYFNMRRSPTTAELELANKWVLEWGLDENAVDAGLKQTAGGSNPSFAYLDRILERRHAPGVAPEQDQLLFEFTKRLMAELGVGRAMPSDDQRGQVQAWLDQGFEHEALLRAAVRCNRSSRRSFDQLELELSRWSALGITTADRADQYNQEQQILRTLCAEVFSRAGLDRRPTEADLDQLRDWQQAAPDDVILYAAECANGLKLPTRAMAKNLGEWAKKGITAVEAAKQERVTRQPRASKPQADNGKPANPALQYEQRTYDPALLDSLFEDFSGDDGGDKG